LRLIKSRAHEPFDVLLIQVNGLGRVPPKKHIALATPLLGALVLTCAHAPRWI
jgi:hypothetical protein